MNWLTIFNQLCYIILFFPSIFSIGSKPVCEQPKITGPCRAYFKKYYFNGRECEEFIYGGCQGNENNFETIEQCEETCEIDIDNTRGQGKADLF